MRHNVLLVFTQSVCVWGVCVCVCGGGGVRVCVCVSVCLCVLVCLRSYVCT